MGQQAPPVYLPVKPKILLLYVLGEAAQLKTCQISPSKYGGYQFYPHLTFCDILFSMLRSASLQFFDWVNPLQGMYKVAFSLYFNINQLTVLFTE